MFFCCPDSEGVKPPRRPSAYLLQPPDPLLQLALLQEAPDFCRDVQPNLRVASHVPHKHKGLIGLQRGSGRALKGTAQPKIKTQIQNVADFVYALFPPPLFWGCPYLNSKGRNKTHLGLLMKIFHILEFTSRRSHLQDDLVHFGADGSVEDLGVGGHEVDEETQVALLFAGEPQGAHVPLLESLRLNRPVQEGKEVHSY